MRKFSCLVSVVIVLASFQVIADESKATPKVSLSIGDIVGSTDGEVVSFLGIPYAAPPVGQNRWREPQPFASGKPTVRQATAFSHSCMQKMHPNGWKPWTHEYMAHETPSEDCLYLNIWTPAHRERKLLPVMVWIHGGGFGEGAGSIPIYNGTALAARGVVVVTFNYRLGVFGFLAHPELSGESSFHVSGNYGVLDMIAALRWVHREIDRFGGDAAHVTIAGQSAGAFAVMSLLQASQVKGLFIQAIAMSGPALPVQSSDLHTAESDGVALATALHAHGVADMRAQPAEQLLNAVPATLKFAPTIDGWLLREDPGTLGSAAQNTGVPILAGMTANEGGPFSPISDFGGPPVDATVKNYEAKLLRDYGKSAADILQRYPVSDDSQVFAVGKNLARDRGVAAMTIWAKSRSRNLDSPIFLYLFNHVEPGPTSAQDGSFHTSDVPYVFQTLSAAAERGFTDTDRRISDAMARYWINFVKSGNPNAPGLKPWPTFNPTDPELMMLDGTFQSRHVLEPHSLAVFENIVANGGHLSLF